MKLSITFIVFTLLVLLASVPTLSQNNENPQTVSFKLKKNNTRPNSPSQQYIYCVYNNGTLSIEFKNPEGLCTLEIKEYSKDESNQFIFDSSETTFLSVGIIDSSSIEITTSFNNTYIGYITN